MKERKSHGWGRMRAMERPVPKVDERHLEKLKALQQDEEDAAFLLRVVCNFLARGLAQIARMRGLVAARDFKMLAHEAHSVAGASGMYGMSRVRQCSLALENLARSGSLEGAEALLDELAREFEEAKPLVRAALGITE